MVVPPEIPISARSPQGARTGLLIRAGDWESAHKIAQDLDTPDGSFWHGILHRQQKDWSNAAYWFRRVGTHPVYPAIFADASRMLSAAGHSGFRLGAEWDPFQLIRWREQTAGQPESAKGQTVAKLQVIEWRHLFEWCVQ